jgi:hypothetical protein
MRGFESCSPTKAPLYAPRLLAAACFGVIVATQGDTFSVVTPTRVMALEDSITRGLSILRCTAE